MSKKVSLETLKKYSEELRSLKKSKQKDKATKERIKELEDLIVDGLALSVDDLALLLTGGVKKENKLATALREKGFEKEAKMVELAMTKAGWESLPKGWTKESAKKFWNSLTGDRKKKISDCMKKMSGKVSNTGAFCASLADLVNYEYKGKK